MERPRVPSPSDVAPTPKPAVVPFQPADGPHKNQINSTGVSHEGPYDPDGRPRSHGPQNSPHKIIGGTYTEWADTFIEAIGTAADPSVVTAWVDANRQQLDRLFKGSLADATRVKTATEAHFDFLHRTNPISTGPQAAREPPGDVLAEMGGEHPSGPDGPQKAPRGRPKGSKAAPDFDKDYDGWLTAQLKEIAAVQDADALDAIYERLDLRWVDLMPPDRDTLLAARREAEFRLEQ